MAGNSARLLLICLVCIVCYTSGYLSGRLPLSQSRRFTASSSDDATGDVVPFSLRDDSIRAASSVQRPMKAALLLLSTMIIPKSTQAAQQWLVEPTSDFKAEVERTNKLAQEQVKIRAGWDQTTAKLEAAKTSAELESLLIDLRKILTKLDGIPTGTRPLLIRNGSSSSSSSRRY
jgi:hypothetical protein